MFDWVASPEGWFALASLVSLEIVLGIDNIIFISILVGRLPEHQRDRARIIGLSLALISRLLLLASLYWIMKLIEPLFTILGQGFTGRDIILIFGGLFLLAKATFEIHHSLEIEQIDEANRKKSITFTMVLIQVAIIDVVFSLDSVITAIGMVKHISIMVIAVLASVAVMMFASKSISLFVDNNPTIKILALSFLMMIGITLVGEGFGMHVPKGYIYFGMAFSLGVELLNIQVRRKIESKPIQLSRYIDPHSANNSLE
jgi:predicted tellurium resistance membrane protein TerC